MLKTTFFLAAILFAVAYADEKCTVPDGDEGDTHDVTCKGLLQYCCRDVGIKGLNVCCNDPETGTFINKFLGLGIGIIVAICVAVIAIPVICIIACCCCCNRRRKTVIVHRAGYA
ncbi:hypothetical protein HDE_07896 [Halotydeus destructor]|nr:hypothetical protein HDE_07896 [Halotydeus destructor]